MSPRTAAVAAPAPARTDRGRRRREAVLDAAAELFAEHGYHGASVDDIGAAAGISGPGVYRHFPSKDAVLMAVLDRLWAWLKPTVVAASALPPDEALETLLRAHLDLAVGQPAAIALLVRELRHLPDDYRALARRNHRRYVDAWVAALAGRAPGLDEERARSVALAVHGLLDSAAIRRQASADLPPAAEQRELLERLARVVLAEALTSDDGR